MKKQRPESSYSDLVVYYTLHQNDSEDEFINGVIEDMIANENLVVIINRNPSLRIESLIAVRVNGVTDDMVLKVPTIVLPSLAADADGRFLPSLNNFNCLETL